ncbi:MAG: hypothetical protein Q9190_004726 [Brigantiaea leucoxantha]
MAFSKNLSAYSSVRASFHLLRLVQLLSALIVTSVVCYFVHFLRIEHYSIPYTFVLLLAVSILAIAALASSSALYHYRTLPPSFNLTNNAALLVFWSFALSFMTWNLGWTLGHRCTIQTWKNETGIMVCRLYKACTAFAVTALLSTLLATILDIHTYRRSIQLGKYNPMQDVKQPIPISCPSTSDVQQPQQHEEEEEEEETAAAAAAADYSDDEKPYKVVQRPIEAQRFGYSQPEEQTKYDGGSWL